MSQHITRSKVFISVATILTAVIAALFLLFVDPAAVFSLDRQSSSVELGLAEYSPRGAAGGQAMPASGSSSPSPTCTLSLEDTEILPGETTILRINTFATAMTNFYEIGQNRINFYRRSGNISGLGVTVPNSERGALGGGEMAAAPAASNSPDNNNQYFYEAEVNRFGHVHTCVTDTPLTILEDGPPAVDLKIEGGENGEITIGEDGEISWNVGGYPHPTCTATTVAPDNTANWTGNKEWDGGPDTVSPNPSLSVGSPSAAYEYTLECENVNGRDSDSGTLTVTSKPNLAVTSVGASVPPPSAGNAFTGTYPDLTVSAVVAAEYADVTALAIPYEFELVDANTGTVVDTDSGGITGGITGGNSKTVQATFNDVSFGDYRVDFSVDLPAPGVVQEDPIGSETVDNQNSSSEFNLPPPTPPMSLTADPSLVRKGQTSDVTWEVNVGYNISCTIDGNFSGVTPPPAISTAAGNLTGTFTTPSLDAETTYTLECTPTGGAPASVTETIRVLPTVEET